jgi:hypothetical protein
MTRAGFAEMVSLAIVAAKGNLTSSARQIAIAHLALESGWGTKSKASSAFNYSNIIGEVLQNDGSWRKLPTTPFWNGEIIEGGDHDTAGNSIRQRFRAYAEQFSGIADYFYLLDSPKYQRAAERMYAGDPTGFCAELSRAGYFQMKVEEYTQLFMGVFASVADVMPPEPSTDGNGDLQAGSGLSEAVIIFGVLGAIGALGVWYAFRSL